MSNVHSFSKKPEAAAGDDDGGTILVVSRSTRLKSSVEKISAGLTVEACRGPRAALKRVLRQAPDMVIYDAPAIGENGFRLLQRLKTDERLHRIPFIILTPGTCEENRLKMLEAGADDYILKPYIEKELHIKILNIARMRRHEKVMERLNKQLERKISEQLETIMKNERLTYFFPRKLVKWILSSDSDVDLKGEKKRLTIFFSDLSGFTELAESTTPERVMDLLNDYFTEMVGIVDRYEGTLDKFIGDGLMVFFGAPEHMGEKEQALRAVCMALEMQSRMKILARKWKEEGIRQNIRIRMGIHQDMVMVGNFGSRQLMEYTVFGSGVNLANRLESYCEPEQILVSYPVFNYTRAYFPFHDVVEQVFRGFERMVPVSVLEPDDVEKIPDILQLLQYPGNEPGDGEW